MKKLPAFLAVFFLISTMIFSDPILVDYYGVVGLDENGEKSDTTMLKMAQDVFYTQLKSIDGIRITDRRPDMLRTLPKIPDFDIIEFQENHFAFYAEITEGKNPQNQNIWKCKFNILNPNNGISRAKNEVYESYYKILTNAKSAIEDILHHQDKSEDFTVQPQENTAILETASKKTGNFDVESLAGTWDGEPFADKIIILRGGRGFVIFKNGATMNIKITAKFEGDSSAIQITQSGKSNASFFPEIPRDKALALATTAEPIIWNFTLTSSNRLEGTKQTFIQESDQIISGKINSAWNRK